MVGAEPRGSRGGDAASGDSPVGRRASRHVWWAPSTESCGAALERLRRTSPGEQPASVMYCFVVDAAEQPVGAAPIAAVVTAAPDTPLADVMNPRVIPIPEGAPEEAIQDFFITYGLLAFPVVDRGGRLVGVVAVEHFTDLVFEGFEAEVREETCTNVGLASRDLEDAPAATAAAARLPWLGITLAGGFMAVLVIGHGALAPALVAAIAAFLPLTVMLAERVTWRTLAVRRAVAAGEGAARRLAVRELTAALLCGLGVGLGAGGLAFLWRGEGRLSLVVALAAGAAVLAGTAVGLLAPLRARGERGARVGLPIALGIADLAAIGALLALARVLLVLPPP